MAQKKKTLKDHNESLKKVIKGKGKSSTGGTIKFPKKKKDAK